MVCTLPIDMKTAREYLSGSNRQAVRREWGSKIKGMSETMKVQLQEEFTKLRKLSYYVRLTDMTAESQKKIMDSGIRHFLSTAPAFKEDDDRNISTRARTTMNGGKARKANISINDLLPTGTLALDMARSFRNFRKHAFCLTADICKF